ncbi:hypothetical protein [Clostridium beijerinckii]|uniref:hypothetical protein n=1 Tax=Clostridium beijerinckii TaxID=1520 RepID=UPI000479023B|nr:hypothetical protein [Clostridium beijerinckii]
MFVKYLSDDVNVFTPLKVTTRHIKNYLEFTKNKGNYTYAVDINSLKLHNPSARGDFEKQVSLYTVNNYMTAKCLSVIRLYKLEPISTVGSLMGI